MEFSWSFPMVFIRFHAFFQAFRGPSGSRQDIKAWLFLTWDQDHLLTEEDYNAIWAASFGP